MPLSRILALGCIILITVSCTMHRVEIQQGNVITPEMIAQLKPGMSRQQVQFVMGTAPIMDPFHPDRWDYVYILTKGKEKVDHRHVTVYFSGDLLDHVKDEQDVATE
ncbi:MAG: outer membrane protein assembly factor BamE [Gammaproteobacteria bacterium]|nr:outer membrane protein assembly factor BamE [Gammaproteobacteria bacterium]